MRRAKDELIRYEEVHMKKSLLLLWIVVSLVVAPISGLGRVPVASATISGFSATANPATPNTTTELTFTFYTQSGVGIGAPIFLVLPDFQLPASISLASVHITGPSGPVSTQQAIVGGTQITVSPSTALAANGYITVRIDTTAGIKTSATAGLKTVSVGTLSETQQNTTISIGSGGSGGVSNVTAVASTLATNSIAVWTVSFVTGTPGILGVGSKIMLTFPTGTQFPSTAFVPGTITVTVGGFIGYVTSVYQVPSTTRLEIDVPGGVSAGAFTTVSVQIGSAYGLRNPSAAGTGYVTAWTTTDTAPATSNPLTFTGGGVTSVSVYASPLSSGTAANYSISFFTTSVNLLAGDTISVQFPSGTTFPASGSYLNPAFVQVNGVNASWLTLSSNTLQIVIPTALAVTSVTVGIQALLGIANPSTPGSYHLTVFTSRDITPVMSANTYDVTGSSIGNLSLSVDPRSVSTAAEYRFTFVTSSSGSLQAGVGIITVDFAAGFTVPASIASGRVTVNGVSASTVTIPSDGVVRITVPYVIPASSSVTIVITSDAGVRNPAASGSSGTITVFTSTDTIPMSTSFTLTNSQIGQPQVVLSAAGTSMQAGYTVTFVTGPAGQLTAGLGKITLTFPAGTSVPTSIARDSVKVNNQTSSNVSVSGLRVEVTIPATIYPNSQVQVVFDKSAGLRNPAVAAAYTLPAFTSAETTPVASASYQIASLPKSSAIISPASPDGLNGYYKTRPVVVLSATNGSGGQVPEYYRINNGAETLYTTPIQIPEGNVTLSYYGRDAQGNQEDANTLTLKVDTTAPEITVTSPQPGTTTGSATLQVSGRTEAGSSVTVAGAAAQVQPSGDFLATVTLSEGPNTLQVIATDLAGNKGQAAVSVSLDTKPPVLTITLPKIYSTVMTQQIAVTGKTESGATVTVAGSQVNVAADGSFSVMYMFPKEGLNVVDITATDAAGNVAKTGIPVTYVARTLIRLQVGNKTAMINDTSKALQAAPINVKGVVMVPLRFIGEAFGATVECEPVFKLIRIQLGSTMIYLQIGSNYASVNGKKIVLQGLPTIVKGTTMVPIRFISEAFNAQVTWIQATQGVEITYPKP